MSRARVRSHNEQSLSIIETIQKEIDENDGFDLGDSDSIDVDEDLETDRKALRRLLEDES